MRRTFVQSLPLTVFLLMHLAGLALSYTTGDLRLAGIGSNRLAGRLEVYYEGHWGTVHGGDASVESVGGHFSMESALVACRQMGLGFPVDYHSSFHRPEGRFRYGRGTGGVFLHEVRCDPSDVHILQCTFGFIGPESSGIEVTRSCPEECGNQCEHCFDVALQCSGFDTPYNGEIRLAPPPSSAPFASSSGVVELYSDNQWRGVCLGGVVSEVVGDTLCRQVGFTDMVSAEQLDDHMTNVTWDLSLSSLTCPTGRGCVSSCLSQLPTSSGASCPTTVLHCRHDYVYENNFFGSRHTCKVETTPIPEKSLRLEPDDDSASRVQHRVDVHINGSWGTFCIRNFTILEGDVVCKQMGFPVITTFSDITNMRSDYVPAGMGTMYDLKCTGLENSVSECAISVSTCTDHNQDVVVQCNDHISPYGSLTLNSLANQVGGASGTLKLFDGIDYRPICDSSFSTEHAQIACRQLGFNTGIPLRNSYFGIESESEMTGLVRLTGTCSGSESHILSCSNTPSTLLSQGERVTGFTEVAEGSEQCRSGLDEVALQCVSTDVMFRLYNNGSAPLGTGPSPDPRSTGILQVNYNGSWRRVCGAGFGWNEALVACRNLGFESTVELQNIGSLGSGFAGVSDVSCFGVEQSLLHCNLSLDAVTCPSDPWIQCGSAPLPTDGTLRLQDGNTTNASASGRLEIKLNKKWLSVCGTFFSPDAATVACRQLGYRRAANYCTDACFGMGEEDIYFAEDWCSGDEASLLECPQERHHPRNCDHASDVGLVCVERIVTAVRTTAGTTPPPKPAAALNYYIIAGAAGGAVLLLVTLVVTICCVCLCRRHLHHKQERTWTNQHQNGHSYHNGAVGDVTNMTKEKEGGFDDPHDLVEPPPTSNFSHDVIAHVLTHPHLQGGDSPRASKKKGKRQQQQQLTSQQMAGRNGFHINTHSANGVVNEVVTMGTGTTMRNGSTSDASSSSSSPSSGAIAMENGVVSGITMTNRGTDASSRPNSDIPMCPPPNYNDLFHSEASPTRHVTGSNHGNRRGNWYDQNAEDKV